MKTMKLFLGLMGVFLFINLHAQNSDKSLSEAYFYIGKYSKCRNQ